MRKILLSRGLHALVDDADYLWLSQWKWSYLGSGGNYACRRDGKKMLLMHRVIMKAPKGGLVDHRNGNGLDNRRSNLRRATRSQNQQNRKGSSGRFKGVFPVTGYPTWRAALCAGYKYVHLGTFKTQKEAAMAYDVAAKAKYGEYALLNFPEKDVA